MKSLMLSSLCAAAVGVAVGANREWNVTTGGAIDEPSNYADQTAPTSEDNLILRKTQTAPVTMNGTSLVVKNIDGQRRSPFIGELALGTDKSLLTSNGCLIEYGSKLHLTSGWFGVDPEAHPTLNFEIAGEYEGGNEFILDGAGVQVTTSTNTQTLSWGYLGRGAIFCRNTPNSLFKVMNGALFRGCFDAFSGLKSTHNTMLVTDAGSRVIVPAGTEGCSGSHDFRWGAKGSENLICISNQASFVCESTSPVYLGITDTAGTGASNRFVVTDRAVTDFRGGVNVGWNVLGSQVEVSDSANLFMTNNNLLVIGQNTSQDATVRLASGGKLTLSANGSAGGYFLGYGSTSTNATLRIESGAELYSAASGSRRFRVGYAGTGAQLIIDGGKYNTPNSAIEQGADGNSGDSSIVVCNGGSLNACACYFGLIGKNHSVAVTNGTVTCSNNAVIQFGTDGGKNTTLSIGGTNSYLAAHNAISFKGNCTINIHVPREGYSGSAKKWAPITSDLGFNFVDKTTINLSADLDYFAGGDSKNRRRVVVMKLSGTKDPIDLTNVQLNLVSAPAGTEIDTSVTGEIALKFHPGKLMLIFR